jgi:Lrp/AsnC family transcriptional regulator, leucine-responsive regulatory protein
MQQKHSAECRKNGLLQKIKTTAKTIDMEKNSVIDATDLAILRELQQNSRLTIKELASKVNLSLSPVHERMKNLERNGYIKKYTTILNAEKLNLGFTVFCKIKMRRINHDIATDFVKSIREIPEVTECYNISGQYDYLLKVSAKDMASYQSFVINVLGRIDSMLSIESTFVMAEEKNTYGINI